MSDFFSKLGTAIGGAIALLLIGIVTAALIIQRSMFPTLSYWIMQDMIVAVILLIPVTIIVGFYIALRGRIVIPDQFGAYIQNIRGTKALPPLTPVSPKTAGATSVSEIKTNVPRLGELIKQGLLFEQNTDGMRMLVGFRQDESPRYEPMPGVIAITGMQNVGKSITMLMLIVIALFQRAHIVICDTHNTKARSLYKKVSALTGLVKFAITEAQVLQETKNFSAELHNRKNGANPYPYMIFYDEFCSLIRSQNKELREQLPVTMEEGSQEGQGYNMHVVAAIHDVSNSGIGDARLRSFFNWIFCHKMEAGQSKFIEAFNSRKNKQIIASLPQGHVVVRDEVNDVEYLIIPFGDSKDVLVAKAMLQGFLPEHSGVQVTRRLELPEQSEHEHSGDMNKPVYSTEDNSMFILEEKQSEGSPEQDMNVQVSDEDAITITNAYVKLVREKGMGGKITRRELLKECGWTNYKWPVLRAYCNERKVLM